MNNQNIDSVYKSLHPLYKLLRCFGLSPYSANLANGSKWSMNRRAKLQIIFITNPLILLGIYPVYMYQQFKFDGSTPEPVSVYSELFRAYSGFIMALLTVTLSLVNGKHICHFMESLNSFDSQLQQLNMFIKHDKVHKTIKFYIIGVYSVIAFIIANDLMVFTKSSSLLMSVLYWLMYIVYFLINATAPVQFSCFLFVLYHRLKIVNEFLENIANKSNEVVKPTGSISYKSVINENIKVKYISVMPSAKNMIDVLRELHDTLCELSKELNKLFAPIILLLIGRTFVVLVQKLYFLYLMLSQNDRYTLTLHKAWGCVIWIFTYFSLVYILCYGCTKTKNEADESSVLLHKINVDIRDEETRTSIEMFSLQMIHQFVEFSACGFFPIDFSVLYMIVGAVTTYLVFLIQFEMTGRAARGF